MARTASANKKRITALAPGAGHIRIQKDAKFSPCRLHRSSLFQCPFLALPCGRQIRWQRVLLPYLGTASDKKTSSGAPHHLAVLLAVLFSHQTRAAVTATAMPPAIAPARGNGKNFYVPGMDHPIPPARQGYGAFLATG